MEEFSKLEAMFPDGFMMMYAKPNGMIGYARFNPRRISSMELMQDIILRMAQHQGPSFWKGFTSSNDIPDHMPPEWGGNE